MKNKTTKKAPTPTKPCKHPHPQALEFLALASGLLHAAARAATLVQLGIMDRGGIEACRDLARRASTLLENATTLSPAHEPHEGNS